MPRMQSEDCRFAGLSQGKDYLDFMKIALKGKDNPVWFVEEQTGAKLFPMQNKIMTEFYAGKYKRLILAAGMRSGKSALASMMGVYELFDLMITEDPSSYYGLLPDQLINISIVATSTTQAQDTIFGNITSMVEGSDFFNSWTDVKVKGDEIRSRKQRTVMRVLSSWSTTAVGRSNKAVIFDELANFEETAGKRGSWEIYTRLSKSTDTFGNTGHIIAISSPKHPTDIMMTLCARSADEANTYSLIKPTWEMNPNFTKQQLMDEYKYDMPAFWRDYACQPHSFSGIQFPEGINLNSDIVNVLQNDILVRDNIIRVCAIDPAVTNDGFGIATGYLAPSGQIVVDGITKFQKTEGMSTISPKEVREFLDDKISKLNIDILIFDTWMYPELLEHVSDDLGVETIKHIVRKDDYDRWRELQSAQLCEVVYDDYLKMEAQQLVVKNEKRVDHPISGSKDMADCVANIMWYISSNLDDMATSPGLIVLQSF